MEPGLVEGPVQIKQTNKQEKEETKQNKNKMGVDD